VQKLDEAGLDFVQITLESHDPAVHDNITCARGSWQETVEGIKNSLASSIYTTTNTTLNKQNARDLIKTIEFLHGLNMKAFGCNSLIYSGKAPKIADKFALTIEELKEILPRIQEKASELGMKFRWYTPTQYCQLDPVSLNLGIKSCSAARINMCVGPQGDVYPCQSYFESVGNILRDDWQKIWDNATCKNIRAREYAPEKCMECEQFNVCGAGCPLELKENKYVCAEAQ
jgi:radical SAM protein with 4Fe4S-binding SPASM domain